MKDWGKGEVLMAGRVAEEGLRHWAEGRGLQDQRSELRGSEMMWVRD